MNKAIINEVILDLHANPNYLALKSYLLQHRPDIPAYKLGEDNTEEWKYSCAKQQGFDLLLTLLKIGVSDDG